MIQPDPADRSSIITKTKPEERRHRLVLILNKLWETIQVKLRNIKGTINVLRQKKIAKNLQRKIQKPTEFPAPISPIEMDEEMVQLYQSIRSQLKDPETMIIQFVGSLRGEGTSNIALEFAHTVALKFSKRTLLFRADWLNDPLCEQLMNNGTKSIEGIAQNGLLLDEAVSRISAGLFQCFISAGQELSPGVYDLPGMKQVWQQLREHFDVVVIDSPPVSSCADGLAICRGVDGVILVMKAESTRWPVAMAAKEKIIKNGGKILGFVFNDRRFYIPGWIYRRL
ncbi:MAG: Tyrosine-protein kinase YwqD [Syntrophorhabdus sp. PtaU1.Bin050]|nr:MAG: Tyrosine-protein kinase YwqD [Syntrophorhabdus sp. PtaU1.Bin050]